MKKEALGKNLGEGRLSNASTFSRITKHLYVLIIMMTIPPVVFALSVFPSLQLTGFISRAFGFTSVFLDVFGLMGLPMAISSLSFILLGVVRYRLSEKVLFPLLIVQIISCMIISSYIISMISSWK